MLIETNKIYLIDALTGLKNIPNNTINCVITSPPYWAQRCYVNPNNSNAKLEIGREPLFKDYIANLISIFSEIKRILKDDGCLFVNLGDVYYGGSRGRGGLSKKQLTNPGAWWVGGDVFKNKETKERSQCLIPYRFAIKMVDELGWINRNIIIWKIPNKFPTSVRNRLTVDWEPILFFVKNKKYYFKQLLEPFSSKSSETNKYTGNFRNKRSVWEIPNHSNHYSHTAQFPEKLIFPLIEAGCPPDGVVLDPFSGNATTAVVAKKLGRKYIGFEISEEFYNDGLNRLQEILL